jgi:hypothetical protein
MHPWQQIGQQGGFTMRRFLITGLVAVVFGLTWLLTIPIAAQSSSSPAKAKPGAEKAWKAPRTADGHPDIGGVWDFRSATPMERPNSLSGKQTLTDEEAANFEAAEAVRNDRDRNVPAGNVGDYNQFWYDRGKKVVGDKRTSLVVDPPDGRIPPLTPEAQKKVDALAETRRGIGTDEPTPGGFVEDLGTGSLRVRCILGFNSGPPMVPSAYNNNVQIVQGAGYVALVNEMVHNTRIVSLDGRAHLDAGIRQWVGDSRGHWEGETLVVDTTNFLRETLFKDSGPNLHLVERFTRVDPNTLLYEFTVSDPTTWTKPWTAAVPMTLNPQPIYEYACHEGNYGLAGIIGGARSREKATEAAGKGSN